jgi:DNA-binding transcriptional LysR family regulator
LCSRRSGQFDALRHAGHQRLAGANGDPRLGLLAQRFAMLPDALVREELAEGKLLPLLGDYRLPVRPMHLVYAQERYRSPKLRSFVEYIVAALGR